MRLYTGDIFGAKLFTYIVWFIGFVAAGVGSHALFTQYSDEPSLDQKELFAISMGVGIKI